jgi:hypothetical protein
MYPFSASFCNKITNYVSQWLEKGVYVSFDILVYFDNVYACNYLTIFYISKVNFLIFSISKEDTMNVRYKSLIQAWLLGFCCFNGIPHIIVTYSSHFLCWYYSVCFRAVFSFLFIKKEIHSVHKVISSMKIDSFFVLFVRKWSHCVWQDWLVGK